MSKSALRLIDPYLEKLFIQYKNNLVDFIQNRNGQVRFDISNYFRESHEINYISKFEIKNKPGSFQYYFSTRQYDFFSLFLLIFFFYFVYLYFVFFLSLSNQCKSFKLYLYILESPKLRKKNLNEYLLMMISIFYLVP